MLYKKGNLKTISNDELFYLYYSFIEFFIADITFKKLETFKSRKNTHKLFQNQVIMEACSGYLSTGI